MRKYEEMLEKETLPCWEAKGMTIREARNAGLKLEAENAKKNWMFILELPSDLQLSIHDYEKANLAKGRFTKKSKEWDYFKSIFECTKWYSYKYVLGKAIQFKEAYNMLMYQVMLFGKKGYF